MDIGLDVSHSYELIHGTGEQFQSHLYPGRHIAHLHTLQKVSRKLNSKLELADVLANILDETIRAIGAERGCLLLGNATTGDLEVHLSHHLHPSELAAGSFRPSWTVIERVWREGQPVLTANAREDPEWAKADSVINYALRSILCVPLLQQGQRIGVLYLDNRLKVGQFQRDDLALVVAIADQAAVALRNAQLHQEAVDRAKKLTEVFQRVQSLSQIGLKFQGLTASTDLFAVIGGELEGFSLPCVIVLLSSDGMRLEVQYVSSTIGTMGSGILGPATKTLSISVGETVICRQVLETRTGRFVSGPGEVMAELLRSPTDPKCQSAFVAPLVTQDRAIGLLILGLDNEQLEDFPLLMAFANQVAATIEICQLHTELQQQLAEMQSVLVVTRALVSEVGLNNLLEFIMTQAEHLTNARGAAVLLLSDDGQWLEVATPGESWLRLKAGSRLPVSESLPGLAIASQQVQISNHAQDDGRTVSVRALLQPTELHSLLCAPLVAQGKGLGVLLVWDKRKHPFTAHDSRLMSLFADQAALALDNAHLHAENRQLAVEQERRRLARELHDSVTQSIYSIAMAAQTSLKLLGQSGVNGKVRDPIEHILEFSGLALAEMRDLLNNLYPADLADKGLVEFLAQHCDMLRAQYSLAIGFTADQEPSLSMPRRQALYCIAREALWNVIKHAVATRVDVSLTSEDDQVVLSIVDDGVGFDPSTLTREEAMGLKTMQERAQLLGGTLKLQSKSGQGTRVAVRFPA